MIDLSSLTITPFRLAVARVVDLLSDEREVVRNEVLLRITVVKERLFSYQMADRTLLIDIGLF